MPALEHIVRPVQSDPFRPQPPSGLRLPNSDIETATISWGNAGDSLFTISASASGKAQERPDHVEVSRRVDVVRVKNTEDPDQFVDVEVMRNYKSINQQTGERLNLDFQPTLASPNVQVLQANVFRESDIVPVSSTSEQDI